MSVNIFWFSFLKPIEKLCTCLRLTEVMLRATEKLEVWHT